MKVSNLGRTIAALSLTLILTKCSKNAVTAVSGKAAAKAAMQSRFETSLQKQGLPAATASSVAGKTAAKSSKAALMGIRLGRRSLHAGETDYQLGAEEFSDSVSGEPLEGLSKAEKKEVVLAVADAIVTVADDLGADRDESAVALSEAIGVLKDSGFDPSEIAGFMGDVAIAMIIALNDDGASNEDIASLYKEIPGQLDEACEGLPPGMIDDAASDLISSSSILDDVGLSAIEITEAGKDFVAEMLGQADNLGFDDSASEWSNFAAMIVQDFNDSSSTDLSAADAQEAVAQAVSEGDLSASSAGDLAAINLATATVDESQLVGDYIAPDDAQASDSSALEFFVSLWQGGAAKFELYIYTNQSSGSISGAISGLMSTDGSVANDLTFALDSSKFNTTTQADSSFTSALLNYSGQCGTIVYTFTDSAGTATVSDNGQSICIQ